MQNLYTKPKSVHLSVEKLDRQGLAEQVIHR